MSTSDDLTELLHAFAGVLSEDELTEVQEFEALTRARGLLGTDE